MKRGDLDYPRNHETGWIKMQRGLGRTESCLRMSGGLALDAGWFDIVPTNGSPCGLPPGSNWQVVWNLHASHLYSEEDCFFPTMRPRKALFSLHSGACSREVGGKHWEPQNGLGCVSEPHKHWADGLTQGWTLSLHTPEFPLNSQWFCLSAILWDTNYILGLQTSNEPAPGRLNLDSLLLRDLIF